VGAGVDSAETAGGVPVDVATLLPPAGVVVLEAVELAEDEVPR
jgi:hypothetical protein